MVHAPRRSFSLSSRSHTRSWIAALALSGLLAACSGADAGGDAKSGESADAKADADKKADAKADKKADAKAEAAGPKLTEPKDPNEACARVVAVAWKGLEGAPESVTRDEAAAKAHAEKLRERLMKGEDIAEVARAESDHERSKAKDGGLGTFTKDKWLDKYSELKEPVFGLKVNELSPVLKTAQGFVIAQRCAVDKVHTRHILIRYKGADRADDDVKRSKDDAKKLADDIFAKIKGGEDFAKQAEKHGEDGTSERGGDLGPIGRGMFVLPYEKAAWAMKPGDTQVVETPMGFHVVQRVADE